MPHDSRSRRRYSKSSGNDESSATTVDGHPVVGDGRGHGIVVADVPDREDQTAAARRLAPQPADLDGVEIRDHGGDLGLRHGRHAHQLDEVGAVLPVRAERERSDARVVRRKPEHVAEVPVRPGPLRRPEQVRQLGEAADHGRGRPGRQHPEDPGSRPVPDERQTLDDARLSPPRRCGASSRRSPVTSPRRSRPWPSSRRACAACG